MSFRLVIDNLNVRLGDTERTFSLETGAWTVESGDVVALTGPSGSGKTLLLELLGLMRPPLSGGYRVEEEDGLAHDLAGAWHAANPQQRCADARARFFGFVPQSGGLLPFLNVSENVEITQQIAERPDPQWRDSLMEALGLAPLAHLRPDALSIGQRQRVAIARALAHRPYCVIADEPTAALDPESGETAMGLLIEAARSGGAATVISSHDTITLAQFRMRRMSLRIHSAPEAAIVESRVLCRDVGQVQEAPVQ